MQITEREYWRARREWAFQHTELWTKGKFITGPIVGIVAFLLQGWLGLRLIAATFQLIVTLIAAYFIVALVQLIANWIYYAPVADDRERAVAIADLKDELEKARNAQAKTPSGYSQSEIAKLGRLQREGNELSKVVISVNSANVIRERDAWLKKHDDWHENVLSILRDRDAAIFEALVTAGDQTKGHAQAIDRVHGDRRGQLFAELERLTRILGRHEIIEQ
jgi:hypothetical protein